MTNCKMFSLKTIHLVICLVSTASASSLPQMIEPNQDWSPSTRLHQVEQIQDYSSTHRDSTELTTASIPTVTESATSVTTTTTTSSTTISEETTQATTKTDLQISRSPSLCKGFCDKFQRATLIKTHGSSNNLQDDEDYYQLLQGFDHRDFVVSDLEYRLVLKRLRQEYEKQMENSSENLNNEEGTAEDGDTTSESEDSSEQSSGANGDQSSPEARSEDWFLDLLGDDEIKSILLFCGHKVHRKCLEAWHEAVHSASIENPNIRCPICIRRDLTKQEQDRTNTPSSETNAAETISTTTTTTTTTNATPIETKSIN